MIGVDYASVDTNAEPDWRTAKKAGIGFAIVRGSYAWWSKNQKKWMISPDPHHQRDWDKIPLVKGAYMFPEPRALESAKSQVQVFSDNVELERGVDLPPILDIEFPDGLVKARLTRKSALSWMKDAAHAMMDAFDVNPMLYTSARVWDGEDDDALNADTMQELVEELKECPLWLARYPYATRTKAVLNPPDMVVPAPVMWGDGNYWIHQYQGDALKTPGFTSTVDLNNFQDVKRGVSGNKVSWIQTRVGISGKDVDGIFGPGTEQAVISFQKKKSLKVTGIVDITTFCALAWV